MTRRDDGAEARFDLSSLFAAETASLRHHLDAAAAASDPDAVEAAVHGARRSLKTLRALLRLLGKPQAHPRHKAIDDALRALAGALARTRDLHVATTTVLRLRRRLKAGRSDAPGRKALRARLAALAAQWSDRAAAVERSRRHSRGDTPALEVIERMLDDLAPSLSAGELADTLAKTYARARDALEAALAGDDSEILHAARSHVVRHQLQTRLLVGLTGKGRARVRQLGRLREWLGLHHDLAVAEALAGETPHAAGLGADMAALVRAEQAALAARCRPVAAALFARKPEAMRDRMEKRLSKAAARHDRQRPG